MPYELFNRSKLKLLPLNERIHDLDSSIMLKLGDPVEPFDNPKLDRLAEAIYSAKQNKATVLVMCGAHVIRSGCAPYIIELMRRGLITHWATNGAGAIHDFEFALIGATTESVAKYISEGQFGLWQETGLLNDIIRRGVSEGLGAGEAIGRYIWENELPGRENSVFAMGYKLGVPCTVHIGIGNDIIHEHPNCDGAALGQGSYTDFLIYAQSITKLEGGVFLDFGSAVAGPEVYLKALSMARNVAKQKGESISHFTTAVFDLQDLEDEDFNSTPDKESDARYYFRPWKTILVRTVADGGKSYYVKGKHRKTFPNLALRAMKLDDGDKK